MPHEPEHEPERDTFFFPPPGGIGPRIPVYVKSIDSDARPKPKKTKDPGLLKPVQPSAFDEPLIGAASSFGRTTGRRLFQAFGRDVPDVLERPTMGPGAGTGKFLSGLLPIPPPPEEVTPFTLIEPFTLGIGGVAAKGVTAGRTALLKGTLPGARGRAAERAFRSGERGIRALASKADDLARPYRAAPAISGAAHIDVKAEAKFAISQPMATDDILKSRFRDDLYGKISQIPGVRAVLSPFNPAVRAGGPGVIARVQAKANFLRERNVPREQIASLLPQAEQREYVRQASILDQEIRAQGASAKEAALNILRRQTPAVSMADAKELVTGIPQTLSNRFPIRWDSNTGLVENITVPEGKSAFFWDVVENWKDYPDIVATRDMRDAVESIGAISEQVYNLLLSEGIKINRRDTLVHLPRLAMGKKVKDLDDVLESLQDKELFDELGLQLSPEEQTAAFAFQNVLEKARKYDTVAEGIKAGVEYNFDLEAAMGRMVDQAYRLIRAKRVTELMAPIGRTSGVEEIFLERVKTAGLQVSAWKRAEAGLNALKTGGRFPRGALRQLKAVSESAYNQVLNTESMRRAVRGRLIEEMKGFQDTLRMRQEVLGKMTSVTVERAARTVTDTAKAAREYADDLTAVAQKELRGAMADIIEDSGVAEAREQAAVLAKVRELQKTILNATTLTHRKNFELPGTLSEFRQIIAPPKTLPYPVAKLKAYARDLKDLETKIVAGAFEDVREIHKVFTDSTARMADSRVLSYAHEAREIAADLERIDTGVRNASYRTVKDIVKDYNTAIARGLRDTEAAVLRTAKKIGKEERDDSLKAQLDQLKDSLKGGSATARADLSKQRSRLAARRRTLGAAQEGEARPTEGPQGLQGRFFPAVVAKEINNKFGQQSQKWLEVVARPADLARTIGVAVDFAAPLIQGLPVLARGNGLIWANATIRHYQAWATPRAMARYAQQNAAFHQEMRNVGGLDLGASEFFASAQAGGLLRRAPIVGPTVSRFGVSFDAFQTVVQTELWKAMRNGAMKSGTSGSRDLGDAIRNIVGVGNQSTIGVGPFQQQVERTFGAFAPRYTRAAFATVADAFRGGIRGHEARRTLTGLALAGSAGYWLLGKAIGQEPQMNPNEPHWLEYRIGDTWIGVGTVQRRIIKTLGAISVIAVDAERRGDAMDPDFWNPLDKEAWRVNPGLQFWRNQAPPLPAVLRDLAFNESYEGTFLEGLPQRALPFTAGAYLGEDKPTLLALPFQVGGFRVSAGEEMPVVLKRLLQEKGLDDTFASSFWKDASEGGFTDKERVAILQDNPGLKEWLDRRTEKQFKGGTEKEQAIYRASQIDHDRLDGELRLTQDLQVGKMAGKDFDRAMRDIALRKSERLGEVFAYLDDEEPPTDPLKAAVWAWQNAFKESEMSGGGLDLDLLDAKLALLESGWDEKTRQFVEDNTGQVYHETKEAQLWESVRVKKRKLDWYRLYEQLPELKSDIESRNFYALYLEHKRQDDVADWLGGYNNSPAVLAGLKRLDDKVEELKTQARLADADLDWGMTLVTGSPPVRLESQAKLAAHLERIDKARGVEALLSGQGTGISASDVILLREAGFDSLESIAAATPGEMFRKMAAVTPQGESKRSEQAIVRYNWIGQAQAILEAKK